MIRFGGFDPNIVFTLGVSDRKTGEFWAVNGRPLEDDSGYQVHASDSNGVAGSSMTILSGYMDFDKAKLALRVGDDAGTPNLSASVSSGGRETKLAVHTWVGLDTRNRNLSLAWGAFGASKGAGGFVKDYAFKVAEPPPEATQRDNLEYYLTNAQSRILYSRKYANYGRETQLEDTQEKLSEAEGCYANFESTVSLYLTANFKGKKTKDPAKKIKKTTAKARRQFGKALSLIEKGAKSTKVWKVLDKAGKLNLKAYEQFRKQADG